MPQIAGRYDPYKDPDFYGLPSDVQREVLRRSDSDFAALEEDVQGEVIGRLEKRTAPETPPAPARPYHPYARFAELAKEYSPITGVPRMYRAAKEFELTTPGKRAKPITEFVAGLGQSLTPVLPLALGAAPVTTILGGAGAYLASRGAEKLAEKAGAEPETAEAIGSVASLLPMGAAVRPVAGALRGAFARPTVPAPPPVAPPVRIAGLLEAPRVEMPAPSALPPPTRPVLTPARPLPEAFEIPSTSPEPPPPALPSGLEARVRAGTELGPLARTIPSRVFGPEAAGIEAGAELGPPALTLPSRVVTPPPRPPRKEFGVQYLGETPELPPSEGPRGFTMAMGPEAAREAYPGLRWAAGKKSLPEAERETARFATEAIERLGYKPARYEKFSPKAVLPAGKSRRIVDPPEQTPPPDALTPRLPPEAQKRVDAFDAYQTWVGERAEAKVLGWLGKREFKDLDMKGREGIFEFQRGSREGRYGDLRRAFDREFTEVQKSGIPIEYEQNYLRQMWANPPEQVEAALGIGRRITGKPTFTLPKVIESYEAGVRLGLTPKHETLSEILQSYVTYARKSVADRKFFDTLREAKLILPQNEAPRGWRLIDPERSPLRTYESRTAAGAVRKYTGGWAAPEEVSTPVNNYLRSGERVPFISALADLTQVMKQMVLTAGPAPGTALNAMGFNMLFRNTVSSRNPASGFLQGTSFLIRPKEAEALFEKNLDVLPFAVRNGLTLHTENTAFKPIAEQVSGALAREGVLGKAAETYKTVGRVLQSWFEDPLHQKVVPALKIQHFRSVYDGLREKGIGEVEAGRTAAGTVNNLFGGINWDMAGRNPVLHEIVRAFVLAPDWVESTFRTGAGTAQSLFNPSDPAGAAYRLFFRNTLAAYVAADVANRATSGHGLHENPPGYRMHLYAGKDAKGNERYVSVFGPTGADMFRLPYDAAVGIMQGDLEAPWRAARYRLGPPIALGSSLLFNRDPFGRPMFGTDVYGRRIPVGRQLYSAAEQFAGTALPQQVEALGALANPRRSLEEVAARATEMPLRYRRPTARTFEQRPPARYRRQPPLLEKLR